MNDQSFCVKVLYIRADQLLRPNVDHVKGFSYTKTFGILARGYKDITFDHSFLGCI